MKHLAIALVALLVLASVSVFADVIDPNVGFCAPPATAAACSTAPDTNPLGTTSFGMWALGANDADAPWYLFIAIPEGSVAPTVSSASFPTISLLGDATLSPGFTNDIYFQTLGLTGLSVGNNSFNTSNMFGSIEQAAFGGTPTFFDVFVFSVSPGFNGNTAYAFSTTALPAGTLIAAEAVEIMPNGNEVQFSTPFTTAGLVTPEPNALALLAAGVMGLLGAIKVRR